jgi:aspartyl protease family protein
MPRSELRKNLLILAAGLLLQTEAWAATVFVMSVAGNQVQIIVDGRTVRSLRVGETSPEGVKLLEIRGAAAVLEVNGRPIALSIGQATVAETVLQGDARGHFRVNALINGISMSGLIDTGASHVSMSMDHARRLGIDLRGAQRGVTQTANGKANVYFVNLGSVQVGEIVLYNVAGQVSEGGAERLPMVLVGMSFLRQVEMRRSGNSMTLSRPHLQ